MAELYNWRFKGLDVVKQDKFDRQTLSRKVLLINWYRYLKVKGNLTNKSIGRE